MVKVPELKSHWIWAVVLIIYICTGVFVLNAPFQMSEATVRAYDYVESLKRGSICVLGGGNVFAFDLESSAGQIAAIKHIARKGLKLVEFPTGIEGIIFHRYCIDAAHVDEQYGGPWKYGRDYVLLPYVPGGTTAVVAFLTNVHNLISTDLFGTPISQIPLMNEIHDYRDIALWFMPHWAAENYSPYIIGERGVPLLFFAQASNYVTAAVYMNIYPDKMWVTNGFLGGAQYEKLVGAPGLGQSAVDGYTLLSGAFIIFVVLGNIQLLSRVGAKKEEVQVKK